MENFDQYLTQLNNFSQEVATHQKIDKQKFTQLEEIQNTFFQQVEPLEKKYGEQIKKVQLDFRAQTDAIFQESYLVNRVRKWLRGYPGDFETLEHVYKGAPYTPQGIGFYFDTYFLTRDLALGVRTRKDQLREILTSELMKRPNNQQVLNIACGSCRELYEMPHILNQKTPHITCTDSDKDALTYAENLLFTQKIELMPKFVLHNALKFINKDYNEVTFKKKDIIYSAGLFDYLKDEGLVKILTALYDLLAEGGILIAPFKDSRFYNKLDYHWLGDWSAFHQRTSEEVLEIFKKAGIHTTEIIPTAVGAINFFLVRK